MRNSSPTEKNKFKKLHQKLLKEKVLFPEKFIDLRINPNILAIESEIFDFEEPIIKSPLLQERIRKNIRKLMVFRVGFNRNIKRHFHEPIQRADFDFGFRVQRTKIFMYF